MLTPKIKKTLLFIGVFLLGITSHIIGALVFLFAIGTLQALWPASLFGQFNDVFPLALQDVEDTYRIGMICGIAFAFLTMGFLGFRKIWIPFWALLTVFSMMGIGIIVSFLT